MKLAIRPLVLSTATFGLMLGVSQNAQAAGLIPRVTATAPGFTINSQGSLAATTNGFGLQGPPLNKPTLTGTHAATIISVTTPATSNAWRSSQLTSSTVGNVTIEFAFNRVYNLAGFSFWNLGGNGTAANQGINTLVIEYKLDGGSWTALTGAPTSFAKGPNTGAVAVQEFSFTPVLATNVRFTNMTTHGTTLSGTSYRIGFNEIQFTSIPEPSSTLALLALGLGGVGLRKRV